MQLLMIDLRYIIRVEDFIHEFFGGLFELFNESRVLVVLVSPGLEQIVLVEMVFGHGLNNFNVLIDLVYWWFIFLT